MQNLRFASEFPEPWNASHRDTHSFGMIFFNKFSGSKPIANEICRIDGYRDITNLLAIYIPIWIPLSWISLTNQIYRDYQLSGNSIRSPALALAFGATALERCNWKMERQFSDTHTYIYANANIYIYVYIIYDMHTIYTCTYHLCISYDVNNKYVYITVHIYIHIYWYGSICR